MNRFGPWIHRLYPEHTKEILVLILVIFCFFFISLCQKNENAITGLRRPQHHEDAVNVPIYYDFPELGIKNKEIQVKVFSVLPDEKTVQDYLIYMEGELIKFLEQQFLGKEKIVGPIRLSSHIGKCKLNYQVFLRNQGKEEVIDQQWIKRKDLAAEAVLDFQYSLEYQNQIRNGSFEIAITKESFHKDYEAFYAYEMGIRKQLSYPPYYFTVGLTLSHKEEQTVVRKSFELLQILRQQLSDKIKILGPTPKPIARTHNLYHYQIIVKYRFEDHLESVLNQILDMTQLPENKDLRLVLDHEPQNFM